MDPMFQIVFEDECLLVVNKPAGVASMGLQPPKQDLLVAVRSYLARSQVDPFVAMANRLDAPVSGLVVISKHPKVADQLRQQQNATQLLKQYQAVVDGHVATDSGVLTDWLRPSKRHRSVSISSAQTEGAQRAQLVYRVVHRGADFTHVTVQLKTGRKHQIRVQFQHAGHPVVGDRKYGSTTSWGAGIALICKQISLMHPRSREQMAWEIEHPHEWQSFLPV